MAKFDESFFEAEEREGFHIESMMKRAWAAEIEVLEEIDRICRKHGIKYFADGGTLLGTVRHKGFIPWDDDIDIAMLREDYEYFVMVAQEELAKDFVIADARICPWNYSEVKGVFNGMEIGYEQNERWRRFHGFPFVASVDIFVLDNLPYEKEKEELQCNLLFLLQTFKDKLSGKKISEEEAEQTVLQIENLLNVKIDRTGKLENEIQKLSDRICRIYEKEDGKEVANLYWLLEHDYCRLKKEWYEDSILMSFENIMVPVPKEYEKVLEVTYGKDYMVPKKMTQSHDYPFYKKQEEAWNEYVKKTMNNMTDVSE